MKHSVYKILNLSDTNIQFRQIAYSEKVKLCMKQQHELSIFLWTREKTLKLVNGEI